MPADDGGDEDDSRARKRRRGPQACGGCRQRKVRCDGDGTNPCANCAASNSECIYGSEPLTKAKSDAILETVLRLENRLSQIGEMLQSSSSAQNNPSIIDVFSPGTLCSTDRRPSTVTGARLLVQNARSHRHSLDNATISSQHASTTESVLAWSHFDVFPSLRNNYQHIFTLEQQRPAFEAKTVSSLPHMDQNEINRIVNSFRTVVNFAYPTASVHQLAEVERRMSRRELDTNVHCAHALITMALGSAARVVGAFQNGDVSYLRNLAETYFNLFLQRLHVVQLEVSTLGTQCLFLAALYFAYLQRPLQAWLYISMAATKCRLLLSYTSADTGADTECIRRIFWSCFNLESDYIAELAALPQSGVGDIESSIPFPAFYNTSTDEKERDQSTLYFLACISMRRLLNRVHDLLYAPDSGVAFDDARFPHVVNELDYQLEEWKACLPSSFQFTTDDREMTSEHGAFLRQRYLTCRAVIYRPFLNQCLTKFACGETVSELVFAQSEICLRMSLLHIMNLRAFKQTVLIDTWICSLSMASTMLILLAASRISALRERLPPCVREVGRHLKTLIEPWMSLHSQVSPSVKQSLRMIEEVDALLQAEFQCHDTRRG